MSLRLSAISVIVPAYKEGGQLAELIRRVFDVLQKSGIEGEVIVVDDDSQDGSQETIETLAREFPVRMFVRKGQRGLSSAVVFGFQQASHDVLVVMDADLQHPPESIPDLIAPIARDEADMVIGSRYVQGARVTVDWPLGRRWASWLATLVCRPLVKATDPMSGFFAIHRSVWEGAVGLRPVGFKIGLELAARARELRIQEVPIVFGSRRGGESKLKMGTAWQFAVQWISLTWFRRPIVFAANCVVGAALVGLVFYNVFFAE